MYFIILAPYYIGVFVIKHFEIITHSESTIIEVWASGLLVIIGSAIPLILLLGIIHGVINWIMGISDDDGGW